MNQIPTLWAAWDLVCGRAASWLQSRIAFCQLRLRGAQVGSNLRVRGWLNLHIHRTAKIQIGADCRLKSGFAENPAGGYRRLGIWVARNATLSIGRNVGISNATIVCAQAVTIEDDVFIGGGTNIYDTDFHSISPDARLARPDSTVKTAPVTIQKRSFIGAHTIILKGVTIGQDAVIGAGAVVTRDVPAGEIWAGNPARQVSRVFPNERI